MNQFRRLFTSQDQVVRIDMGLPDKTDYDYDLFKPVAVHMKIAAE